MLTVVGVNAVFQLETEILEELFVILAVVVQHGEQLALDLFFQPGGDYLELAVVLKHFPGNVQRQVL